VCQLARAAPGGARARTGGGGGARPGPAQVRLPVRPVTQRCGEHGGRFPVIVLAGLRQIGDTGLERPLQVLDAPLVRLADAPAFFDGPGNALAARDVSFHAAVFTGLGAAQQELDTGGLCDGHRLLPVRRHGKLTPQ